MIQSTAHEKRRPVLSVLEAEAAVDKFRAALYTQSEAARFLARPESTFRNWARGYHSIVHGREVRGAPILSTVPRIGRAGPNIPFIGLAEGYALNAMRKTGVSLRRIRPALQRLDDEFGLPHALASHRLFTDGAEVLFDYARNAGGEEEGAVRELVVVRDGQRVFTDVVENYLQQIEFGDDGFASAIPLPGFRGHVVADVRRSFGQPIFDRGGIRLEDAISLFKAERDLRVVSAEYDIPVTDLEDVLAALLS